MKLSEDLILVSPKDARAFTLSEEKGTRLWRKELIYPGQFIQKRNGKDLFPFEVTEEDLDRWAKTFSDYTEAGHEVPVPVEHTTDPEANRGYVRRMAKEFDDEKKRFGLYGYVEFASGHEKLANTTNVSIHCPAAWKDAKGKVFEQPIRHVALTTNPLIPGLGKFKAIVASMADDSETPDMMMELADALGVTYEDGADDATIMQAIIDKFGPDAEGETPPADGEETFSASQVEKIVLQDRKERKTLALSEGINVMTIPASLAKTVANGRVGAINALVGKKITPAKAKQLIKRYADTDHVELTLSSEANGESGDAFEEVMAALSDMPDLDLNLSEQTGHQSGNEGKNPLIADAESRCKPSK